MRYSNRKTLTILAVYLSMMVLPVAAFLVGWIGWDVRIGAAAGLVAFVVCFAVGLAYAFFSRDVSPWLASIPYFFGLMYTLLPDFLPGPLDDLAVALAGSVFTFFIWLRRIPDTPRWIIFPLLLASLYTFLGYLIPTPADEMIVFALGAAAAAFGIFYRHTPKTAAPLVRIAPEPDDEASVSEVDLATAQPPVDEPAGA